MSEQGDGWTFDVALSFAAPDRAIVRQTAHALTDQGLTVFFDEFLQAHLVGQYLPALLPQIYRAARLCVPFLSKSYADRPYPTIERQAILDRAFLEGADVLFPVRLEDVNIPGLPKGIGYVEISQHGPEGLAKMIAERLRNPVPVRLRTLPSTITPSPAARTPLPSHSRRPVPESFVISDRDVLDLALDDSQYVSPLLRARVARELHTFLVWRRGLAPGQPYAAWREGDHLLLSLLPSLTEAHRTLCFEVYRDRRELRLAHEWRTESAAYTKLEPSEWHRGVAGLVADRADLDLNREATILLLEKRRAKFGYPVVPGSGAEKLCAWIRRAPPEDYLEWNRDPRLVPGELGVWSTVEHGPTGVGLLVFTLLGRWSQSAFDALGEALAILLPGRHRMDVLDPGQMRVAVLLAVGRGDGNEKHNEYEYHLIETALRRTVAAVTRMVAAGRRMPLSPPDPARALRVPTSLQRSLFADAVNAIGPGQRPRARDRADSGWANAIWRKLRHSRDPHLGFTEDPTAHRFQFGSAVTKGEVKAAIIRLEG